MEERTGKFCRTYTLLTALLSRRGGSGTVKKSSSFGVSVSGTNRADGEKTECDAPLPAALPEALLFLCFRLLTYKFYCK